jgi:hypothetical protein
MSGNESGYRCIVLVLVVLVMKESVNLGDIQVAWNILVKRILKRLCVVVVGCGLELACSV